MEKLTLDSNLKNITAVEKFAERICDQYHLNETHFGSILLALTEAFSNAVIHGNKKDPSKKVVITFDPVQRGLLFSVSDEGVGFDPKNLPNPITVDDANYKKTGKGLFLIISLTDDLSFSNDGRTIDMTFDIDGIGQKVMNHRKKVFNQYFQKEKQKV